MRIFAKNLKNFGGKEDIKSLPPSWATNIPAQFPDIMVFEPWTYTTPLTNSKNRPIKSIQVKHGTSLPTWVTLTWSATNAGGSVTMAGTPDSLSQLGTTSFTLSAINDTGITDHNFTIVVIDGDTPTWNSNNLSSTSVTVFDAFSGNVSITTPIAGPLTSVVLKSGTFPGWATLSTNGNTTTVTGTPNNLSQLGTYTFILTANNRYGGTDHTFNITVNNGVIPSWNAGSFPSGTSTNAYSSTVSVNVPSNGPLTNVVANSGFPSWATLSYNSTSGVITVSGNSPSPGSNSFTITATNRYGSATSQSFSIVIIDSSVAFLTHFDNGLGGSFVDSSSNGYLLTPTALTQYPIIKKFGANSAYFNGSSSYLQGPSGNNAFKFAADFTVEFWVYPISVSNQPVIFSSHSTGDNATGIHIQLQPSSIWVGSNSNWLTANSGAALNTWSHVAVVRSGTTITVYLNGVSVGSVTKSDNFSDGYCFIGKYTSNALYFNGFIDEFRISQSAAGQGGARYTSSFTPSSSPFTNDANTSLLLHFDNDFTDSSNSLSITNNNVSFLPKFGTACAQFDGSTSYLTGLSGSGTKFAGDFTVEFWLYNRVSTQSSFFSNLSSINNSSGFLLFQSNENNRAFKFYTAGQVAITHQTVIALNAWTHLACVRSNGVISLYVNGIASSSISNNSSNFNDGLCYIGYDGGITGVGYTNGLIDEFRVSNIARYLPFIPSTSAFSADSSTNLLLHFDNNITDSSLNPISLTNHGVSFSNSTIKVGSYSAYFNGSSNITGPNGNNAFKFAGDFTIECWVYPTSFSPDNTKVFDCRNSSGLEMSWSPNGGTLSCAGASGTWTQGTNTWSHIAIVRNGMGSNNISLYVNGSVIGIATSTTNYSDGYLAIGSTSSGGYTYYFRGYMDEFRISNSARYSSNFTPPTSAFTTDSNTNYLIHFDALNNDVSNNAVPLTYNGTPYAAPKFGSSCAKFDGSSYLTNSNNNIPLQFGTGNYTIEGWFLITSLISTAMFVDLRSSAGAGAYLGYNSSGANIQFATSQKAANNIPVGKWFHLAVCRVGTTSTAYIDGVAINGGTITDNSNYTQGYINIGSDCYGNQRHIGYIDEIRIVKGTALYNGNFTPPTSQLSAISGTSLLLHFDGNFTDSSSNNFELTNSGTDWAHRVLCVAPPKFGNGAMYFDGSTNTVQSAVVGPWTRFAGNFTIDFWLYQLTAPGTQYVLSVGSGGWGAPGSNGFEFCMSGTDNLRVFFYNGSFTTISGPTPNTLNSWSHIAIVRNGSTITVYLNGVSQGSTTSSANFTAGNLIVGKQGSQAFYGLIDELRVLNGSAAWTGNFTPPTSSY